MTVTYRITGNDKATEKLVYAFVVKPERVAEVREIGRVPTEQAETFGAFPLQRIDAWTIAWRLQLPVNVDYCDWFFEPFGEAEAAE